MRAEPKAPASPGNGGFRTARIHAAPLSWIALDQARLGAFGRPNIPAGQVLLRHV
jgi:hypothetical protein